MLQKLHNPNMFCDRNAINFWQSQAYEKLNTLAYKCEQLFTLHDLNVAISLDRLLLKHLSAFKLQGSKVQKSLETDHAGATKGFGYNTVGKIILNFQNVIQF